MFRIGWTAELRTVTENLGKNVVSAVPGASQLKRRLLGSGHWAGIYDAAWIHRRGCQIREILDGFRDAWADWSWLHGRTTLEIGSGPDIAVPFAFQACGAGRSYASDVEPGAVSLPEDARKAFRALAASYGASNAISDAEIEAGVERVLPVYAEKLRDSFEPGAIDLIVSTSVLEHVEDPRRMLEQMYTVLRPGGRMVHVIATGNHCCGPGDKAPLDHLIYPDWLWHAMFSHRVGHNRLRWFEWRSLIEAAAFRIDHARSNDANAAYLAEVQPRLAKRFRVMTPEQLAPSYLVVACTKLG